MQVQNFENNYYVQKVTTLSIHAYYNSIYNWSRLEIKINQSRLETQIFSVSLIVTESRKTFPPTRGSNYIWVRHTQSKFNWIDNKHAKLTIEIAFSTSSLFRPAKRPLKCSNASLSFFRRTCPSKEATSLSFAWITRKNVDSLCRQVGDNE